MWSQIHRELRFISKKTFNKIEKIKLKSVEKKPANASETAEIMRSEEFQNWADYFIGKDYEIA